MSGRAFNDGDQVTTPHVVLVNQAFVRRYFQGRDPLGKQIQVNSPHSLPAWSEIVGVVSDVKTF